MVNGPQQVYVERRGKLELTDVAVPRQQHLMNVATTHRHAASAAASTRSSPLVDARLPDGSRVNIIIPPLAIDGASISIRKFAKKTITLDIMARQRQHLAGDGDGAEDRRALPAQHPDLGRHRLGQDDAAERAVADDRHGRAHRHDRGRGRTAAAAAARRPAGNPPGQPRGQRRDHDARPGEERAAHAARPHHHRRGAAAPRRSTCCRR